MIRIALALTTVFTLALSPLHAEPETTPKIAAERIVLSTDLGDLVLALYPDVAPKHVEQIKKLVEIGAYDTTHFFRIETGFIIQLSHIQDRRRPLSADQQNAEVPIPAEFSASLKHKLGSLSMARWDDPNSALSSFSILLGDAPHLDGKYTIFGHVESGNLVLQALANAPRNGTSPISRLTVRRARLVEDIEQYYQHTPIDPVSPILYDYASQTDAQRTERNHRALSFILAAMLTVNVTGYLFRHMLTTNNLRSLLLVNVLIGGFGLLIVFLPLGQDQSIVGVGLFFGMFAMFRLMSQFET